VKRMAAKGFLPGICVCGIFMILAAGCASKKGIVAKGPESADSGGSATAPFIPPASEAGTEERQDAETRLTEARREEIRKQISALAPSEQRSAESPEPDGDPVVRSGEEAETPAATLRMRELVRRAELARPAIYQRICERLTRIYDPSEAPPPDKSPIRTRRGKNGNGDVPPPDLRTQAARDLVAVLQRPLRERRSVQPCFPDDPLYFADAQGIIEEALGLQEGAAGDESTLQRRASGIKKALVQAFAEEAKDRLDAMQKKKSNGADRQLHCLKALAIEAQGWGIDLPALGVVQEIREQLEDADPSQCPDDYRFRI